VSKDFDPAHIHALRAQGFSYTDIGAQLGTTKDAVRGQHTRWLARRGNAQVPDAPAVPSDREGNAAGRLFIPPPVYPEGPGGDGGSEGAVAATAGVKTEIEMARAAIARVTRAEVRLRHSLLADREINELLAKRLRDFDAALQSGIMPSLALRLVSDATD